METLADFYLQSMEMWFDWLTLTWWRQSLVFLLGLGLIWLSRKREPQLGRAIALSCALFVSIPPLFFIGSGPENIPAALNSSSSTKLPSQNFNTRFVEPKIPPAEFNPPQGDQSFTRVESGERLATAHANSFFDWAFWLFNVWLCGSLVILWRICTSSLPLWRQTLNSRQFPRSVLPKFADGIDIRMHADVRVPFVSAWPGGVRIVLPESWHIGLSPQQEAMLAHELAHVKQHDHLWILYFAVLKTILWWNPLMWLVSRSFQINSELSCDDQARFTSNMSPDEFARTLLSAASKLRSEHSLAVAFAHKHSLVKRRILHQFEFKRTTSMPKTLITAFGIIVLPLLLLLHNSENADWGFSINLQAKDMASAETQSVTENTQNVESEVAIRKESQANIQKDHHLSESVVHINTPDEAAIKNENKQQDNATRSVDSEAVDISQSSEREDEAKTKPQSEVIDMQKLDQELQLATKRLQEAMQRKMTHEQALAKQMRTSLDSVTLPDAEAGRDAALSTKHGEEIDQNDAGTSQIFEQLEAPNFRDCAVHIRSHFPSDAESRRKYFREARNKYPSAKSAGARVFFKIDVNAAGNVTNVSVDEEASHILYGPDNAANLAGFIEQGLHLIEYMTFHPKHVAGTAVDGSMVWVFENDPIATLMDYKLKTERINAQLD